VLFRSPAILTLVAVSASWRAAVVEPAGPRLTGAVLTTGLGKLQNHERVTEVFTSLGIPMISEGQEFIRSKRGVRLSEAGRLVHDDAARLLDLAEAMKERVARRTQALAGRVRAAAATQAFVHLFAPLFEAFMRAHPGVELTFRTTVSTDQTVADILSGSADVGFASLAVYSPALRVSQLFEDELMLVVAPGHPLAGQGEAAVEQLAGARFILFATHGAPIPAYPDGDPRVDPMYPVPPHSIQPTPS
jgi:DNA-binding transcriptional LysR family regulator